MSHTIRRVLLTVGDVTYPLAATEHVDGLKAAIRNAVRSGADFVDVTLDTGSRIGIFATTASVMSITVDNEKVSAGTAADQEALDCPGACTGTYDIDTSFDII
ncbi:hypothetical protein [Microbacterium testaceum]|uniref:hypothetical protein n=1 Tax=Microbacterium testaceum TaxID=2033 RepID=UPI001247A884|nr:hypothetical protein [Microbacterium testaceum]